MDVDIELDLGAISGVLGGGGSDGRPPTCESGGEDLSFGGGVLTSKSCSSRANSVFSRFVMSTRVVNDEMSTELLLVISMGPLFFKA